MTTKDQMPEDRACYRSACRTAKTPKWWWNPSTLHWYCQKCALAINEGTYPQLCIPETSLPPLEDAAKVTALGQLLSQSQNAAINLARQNDALEAENTKLRTKLKAAVEGLEKIVAGNYSAQTNQIAYHTLIELGVPKK